MLEAVGKLGVYGGIGFLVGLVLLDWIGPQTTGGRALLILICIVVAVVIGRTIEAISTRAARGNEKK